VTGLEVDMKSRFIASTAVCMFVPVTLFAQPARRTQLVGVWAVKEAPVGQSQSPLLSVAMFSADGSFTTAVGYKALPAIRAIEDVATELGPGYGRWAAAGDREFQLTFYSVMWRTGLVNGSNPFSASRIAASCPKPVPAPVIKTLFIVVSSS
jgi:hypothetical protein